MKMKDRLRKRRLAVDQPSPPKSNGEIKKEEAAYRGAADLAGELIDLCLHGITGGYVSTGNTEVHWCCAALCCAVLRCAVLILDTD